MDDRKKHIRTPDERTWLDDTETYVIQVNRYDTDDLLTAMQYFLLMRDDSAPGRYFVTSVAKPQPSSG